MAYPYDLYENMFISETGSVPTIEEKKYLKKFSNISELSSSKKTYCMALYYLKRFLPLFIVKFLINNRIKRILINENAPDTIQKLYKEIAEIIIYSAIKNYAKGSGKCN